ncbi:esterase-like activity of phytase family protein [Tropicimonas sediminicola]|uniref:Phytase-like domain-containing protein n=1 Tax=Tropicimonas sediminicola TaxID=1031541 RepID=A0A239KUY5_9RHOB|nr:esterase-like activity of phytase family protein [Tropicimonas sediminicola]SNT22177.1 hypothetical protein SAMN05421757_10850 [Tropicimonas sediminicola]
MRRRPRLALTLLVALAGVAGVAARSHAPATVTRVDWHGDAELFGGWSGIDVSDDGATFWAVSDAGLITRGRLLRQNGQLVGIEAEAPWTIAGERTPENLFLGSDSEGISIASDGSLAISYEGMNRVWLYDDPHARATRLDQAGAFLELENNKGLEAVATAPDGALLAIPENLPEGWEDYPVFRHAGDRWDQPFALEQEGLWRSVGADFGPDGRLYLLERKFVAIGFASRIRRFDLSDPAEVKPGETIFSSPVGRHDNLEGIGIWRDPDGRLRAVMVSDDNFLPFLRSEIVEAILPD